MSRSHRGRVLSIAGSVLFLVLVVWLFLPLLLSFYHPVNSNNVLIESWISSRELELAVQHYKNTPGIQWYITGYNYPTADSGFFEKLQSCSSENISEDTKGKWLLANASIHIKIPDEISFNCGDTVPVSVECKGQQAAGYFAFFNLIVNGEKLGGSYSNEHLKPYTFQWIADTSRPCVFIRFNNDLKTDTSDRNLFIKSLQLGDHKIILNDQNACVVRERNRYTTGFNSEADEIKHYLTMLQIDPSHIIIIPFDRAGKNQTLAASNEFNDFIAGRKLNDLNIITSQIHSRRTWVTYKKVLGRQINAGVIYFPEDHQGHLFYFGFHHPGLLLDEAFSYLENWVSLNL